MEQDRKEMVRKQEEDVDGALPPQDNNKVGGREVVKVFSDLDDGMPLPIIPPCGVVEGERGADV